MKGVGWIVILLGLLGVGYLLARDLGVLRGERGGRVVVEPLERAREVSDLARRTQGAIDQALERIDRD